MDLEFKQRVGDYELRATPKHLVRFKEGEPNVTVDFVKYYRNSDGIECVYSIGYFWHDDKEGRWELKFVGDRFTRVKNDEVAEMWQFLKDAYRALEDWENEDC